MPPVSEFELDSTIRNCNWVELCSISFSESEFGISVFRVASKIFDTMTSEWTIELNEKINVPMEYDSCTKTFPLEWPLDTLTLCCEGDGDQGNSLSGRHFSSLEYLQDHKLPCQSGTLTRGPILLLTLFESVLGQAPKLHLPFRWREIDLNSTSTQQNVSVRQGFEYGELTVRFFLIIPSCCADSSPFQWILWSFQWHIWKVL